MKKEILFNKYSFFPHISVSLILSCLIISIPILFNDVLYAFLAANVGLAYPWQYVTSVFAHGPEPAIIIHLIINLLILICFTVTTERIIGTWRVFLMLVIVAIIITFIRFETLNFYNGISYFLFVFVPFALIILIEKLKIHQKHFLLDTYNILFLLMLFAVIIFYPLYFSAIDTIFCERNILHLISILLGMIFLLTWRKRFTNNLKEINQETDYIQKSTIWDKISLTMGYLITTINLLVLIVLFAFFY